MFLPLRSLMLAAAMAVSTVAPAFAQNGNLTFLHFNDVSEITPQKGKGGLASLMTLLAAERQRNPAAITTLGGDFLSPSLMSGTDKGASMVATLNAVGVDVAVFGNHEFDFGADVAVRRLSESKFPWLGSNIRAKDGKPLAGAADVWTRQVGDIKVGVFGVLTPEAAELSNAGSGLSFAAVRKAAEAAVGALKADGADVIVALTHETIEMDRQLAREVKGIALVMGGHDHDPIAWYEGDTLIVKSGNDARFLGVIDLAVSTRTTDKGPVTTVTPAAWSLKTTAGVTPDPDTAALVKGFTDKLDASMNVVIGVAATDLDSRKDGVRTVETTMGDLVADALRAHFKADVALVNGGGIRGDAMRSAGTPITRRDVFAELPFGNVGVLVVLKGTDLRAAVESGVSQVADKAGRFPQVSGLSFTYDPKAPAGSRVLEIKVGGQPLDPEAVYTVATNDYMLGGGDGYATLGKGRIIVNASGAMLLATIVMDYITEQKTVAPKLEGRITAKN